MKKNCKAMEFLLIVVLIGMVVVVLAGGLNVKEPVKDVKPTPEIVEDEIDIPEEPIVVPEVTNIIATEPEENEQNTYPLLYTDKDAVVLAQMLWGEARGVDDLTLSDGRVISAAAQQAACMWTVLNRYDVDWKGTIVEVVTAPKQFVGYSSSHPVDKELLGLAYDVLDRWNREKHGETNVGRVLPSDYYWFASGGDGHNYFRNEYRTDKRWQWELGDPYAWTME